MSIINSMLLYVINYLLWVLVKYFYLRYSEDTNNYFLLELMVNAKLTILYAHLPICDKLATKSWRR